MANKKISDFADASLPLAGTEMLELETADGLSRKVSAQLVADLASGGGVPEAPEDGVLYGRKDGDWVEVPGAGPAPSQDYEVLTEAAAFTAVPATHAGRNRIILAGGNVTFNTSGIDTGQCYNIRSTGAVMLVGSGVTLTPTDGGTLAMTANMQVTVVMTSGTTGVVMGLTVAP